MITGRMAMATIMYTLPISNLRKSAQLCNEDGQGLFVGAVQHQSGDEVVVPAGHEGKDGLHRQSRLHDGQHDLIKGMEHLRRRFRFTCTHLGPHGLPLIGRADWNDCLNLDCFSEHPGESFQITGPSEGPVAESVFIAGMFVKYGREYAELCDRLQLADEAAAARRSIDAVEQAALTA